MSTAVAQRLAQLANDPTVAGIKITTEYKSGNLTITPPAGHLNGKDGEEPGLFTLPDGTKGVSLDTWASQANRFEAAIKSVAEEINYPLFTVGDTEQAITSLDFPHRHADAHWRLLTHSPDIKTLGVPVQEIAEATVENARVLLQHFPNSVLFGWWHSRSAAADAAKKATQVKLDPTLWDEVKETTTRRQSDGRSSRVISSEIIAKGVTVRSRLAARIDPFGALPPKDKAGYSLAGLGTIPPSDGPKDVIATSVEGVTFLSLAYLRRFNFGDEQQTSDGRVLVTALGLLGFTLAANDLHLRSGADLTVASRTASIESSVAPSWAFALPDTDELIEIVKEYGVKANWVGNRTITATASYKAVESAAKSHATDSE